MIDDDLRQPLKRRKFRDKLAWMRPSALRGVSILVLVASAGLAAWAVRTGDSSAGEPMVTVAVERVDPTITSSLSKPQEPEQQEETAEAEPEPDDPLPEPSDETIAADELELQQQVAITQPSQKRLAAAPIRSVSEKGPFGTLPRIARNGKKPWLVYARPVSQGTLASDTPKIAVVLGGLGLNAKLTRQAVEELPGEVTLAFAPYGKNLQTHVNYARKQGHEILLQLPMEPFGYPSVDPGPKTLLVADAADKTLKNLKWHMGRFAGYVGIINYMGARYTSEGDSIGYVLQDIKNRGLLYLDDGSSPRSIVPSLGQVVNAPVRSAHMVIDNEVTFNAISASLARLEQMATEEGFAIGVGSGLPLTIDALSSWARDLSGRNIMLVPLSAIYRPQQS